MLGYHSAVDQLFSCIAVIQAIAHVLHAKYEDGILIFARAERSLTAPWEQRYVMEVYNCLRPSNF